MSTERVPARTKLGLVLGAAALLAAAGAGMFLPSEPAPVAAPAAAPALDKPSPSPRKPDNRPRGKRRRRPAKTAR